MTAGATLNDAYASAMSEIGSRVQSANYLSSVSTTVATDAEASRAGQAGVNLPHSSQALARGGQSVSTDQMQPGDLVTYYSDASHVGIYIGDGMMVHASTYGSPVAVAPVNNAPIHNVRRY